MYTDVYQPSPPNNVAIADIFHHIAACYRYMGKDHYDQVQAYDRAATCLRRLPVDIEVFRSRLRELTGLTDVIRNEITEFLDAGCIQHYQRFKNKVPFELLDLLEIKGFGPSTVKLLHETCGIQNRDQLITALQYGRLDDVGEISPVKLDLLKRSFKLHKSSTNRLLLWDAMLQGHEILRVLRLVKGVAHAEIAGSLRRGCETIGDLDMVLQVEEPDREQVTTQIVQLPHVENVVLHGRNRICVVLYNNTQLDIRMAGATAFGASWLYYTGSREHLLHLSDLAEQKGFILSPEGLFDTMCNYVAGASEESIYQALDIAFIPAELRESGKEIRRAARHMLPQLLAHHQIKGDLRMHVDEHLHDSIATTAHYVMNAFPHYEYIVAAAHGDTQDKKGLAAWISNIDRINEQIGFSFLKKGLTVEILQDGTPALPGSLLQQFDWVTGIVLNDTEKEITQRLLTACEHPYIHCIGNPSNRIIGKKKPSIVNWELLFEKAAATNTALEINAQPCRMDLRDEWVRRAVEKKVYLAIGSCAAIMRQVDYMQLGVTLARRGWCKCENILNTMHWEAIEEFKTARENALSLTNIKHV
ncbi:DNA polymerase III [Chitinophaga sp. LS1]|uniref:DNA polymerase III n=1 Tax=Chitinophaga sp. LS1 TaxID=3051176 RepID=UPI002AAAEB23|nr:DNA polymerase III [Chitinophaga sp. LS1]WPV64872.1 DNA polymerase III [Chitinophaga sp. LS1]